MIYERVNGTIHKIVKSQRDICIRDINTLTKFSMTHCYEVEIKSLKIENTAFIAPL